jgi:hypothetical protein
MRDHYPEIDIDRNCYIAVIEVKPLRVAEGELGEAPEDRSVTIWGGTAALDRLRLAMHTNRLALINREGFIALDWHPQE